MNNSSLHVRGWICLAAALLVCTCSAAEAQFQPRRAAPTVMGEAYLVEVLGDLWFPTSDVTIADTGGGLTGSNVNLKNDLGLVDRHFGAYSLTIHPARKHKFRVQFVPVKFSQTATPTGPLVFDGHIFAAGVPINSSLDAKIFRFGYEYDFISAGAGFFGVIVEGKYSEFNTSLTNAATSGTSAAKVILPALGGIGRVYLTERISVTGELTGIKIPTTSTRSGHYADVDVFGTFNFSEHIAAQGGYRSFDLQYTVNQDTGSMTLKGNYVGLTIRF
jgi:hypothetical protein